MKFSTVFVLTTAASASTGSAAVVKNYVGNLRANAPQKDTEVFDDTSIQTNQDAFITCAASCTPDKKDVYKGEKEEELAEAMAACIDECVAFASNGDTAARAAIESGEAQCATSCTTTAAKKFEEVSKDCAKMKSTHCKRGKDCKEDCAPGDSKCEKKKKECEDDFDDCEECEDELEKAEKSVKKVGNELQKCFVKDCGVEFSSFRAITLQEDTEIFEDTSLQTNQEALESCQCTPDSKDADKLIGETEAELAASMAACVEECYGITSDDPAARSSEAQCALSCTVTAAEKFEEVSKHCEKMKSTHCKNDCDKDCAEGDSSCENEVEKCEKEFKECEKCADEVDELERSLDKVASTYDSCVAKGCVTQFAVEVAQQ